MNKLRTTAQEVRGLYGGGTSLARRLFEILTQTGLRLDLQLKTGT